MAPEKVTEMVLNVDLKCSGCYKKVKKIICKIPQIRDQLFDVEKNKVKIMVVCCSPEKIRDKLCYKGNGAIQSIEIIEKNEKPKEAEKPKPAADKPKEPEKAKPAAATDKPKETVKAKPAAAAAEKPKEPEKAKPAAAAAADKPKEAAKPKEPEKPKAADKPKEPEKPKAAADKPKDAAGKPPAEKPKDAEKPKEGGKPAAAAPPKKPDAGPPNPDHVAKMVYEPVHGYPQMYPPAGYPMIGYGQYYDQGNGGPQYQHGYGMPLLTAPSYGGGFGAYEQGYNGYNDNRSHYASNHYGGEEDGEGCSIM